MAVVMKTPGVYIVEQNAFPNSVVEVATAVPAFIGYTERADDKGKSLLMKPKRISSMNEFHNHFGFAPEPSFDIVDNGVSDDDADFQQTAAPGAKPTNCMLKQKAGRYFLYAGMRQFFMNGGGPCYVVSVGSFGKPIKSGQLVAGIETLIKESEPTLLVIPDCVLLNEAGSANASPGDCITVQQAMLKQCGELHNRFAILDLWGGWQDKEDCVPAFRDALGVNYLDYAAAYYPWLHTTVVQEADLGYRHFTPDAQAKLTKLLQRTVTAGVVAEVNKITWDDARWKAAAANRGQKKTDAELEEQAQAYRDAKSPADESALKSVAAADKAARLVADAAAAEAKAEQAAETLKSADAEAATAAAGTDEAAKTRTADAAKTAKEAAEGLKAAAEKAKGDAATALKEAEAAATLAKDTAGTLDAVFNLDDKGLGWVEASRKMLDEALISQSPLYKTIVGAMRKRLNLLPPSAAMAGIYTMVDNTRGVWKAPANVSLNGVVAPAVNLSKEDQEDLNVTPQGKSINAIRAFMGEGVLVWGARTLNGNSLDWRYVNVRRTMIMLEESCRLAAKALVFEPNVSSTWVSIKSMIENFLTSVWKRGGLAGAVPADAFSVHVGLGDTMTPEDILEGILRVTVLVAVSRPAEFIEITFKQQMQKS